MAAILKRRFIIHITNNIGQTEREIEPSESTLMLASETLMNCVGKVSFIKFLRKEYDLGLKEAKDMADTLVQEASTYKWG